MLFVASAGFFFKAVAPAAAPVAPLIPAKTYPAVFWLLLKQAAAMVPVRPLQTPRLKGFKVSNDRWLVNFIEL